MKIRLLKEIKKLCPVLIIGTLYFISSSFGISVPCPFYKITGLLCPSCGITRMLIAAARGNFKEAFGYNSFLFISFPLIILFIVIEDIHYIKNGERKLLKATRIFLWLEITALICFCILRNIIH